MPKRRNLLLILADQQRSDTLACYGNDFVKAPHLNEFAAQSFVFRRAYCVQPVCTPSRATLMTGLWPHTHGCVKKNIPLPTNRPTLAELVPPEYRRAYYGKWHLGDELVSQHGFEEWLSIEDGHYRQYFSSREQLELRSEYHHFLVQHGFQPDSRAKDGVPIFSRWFAARLAERFTKASYLGGEAARFLREYGRSDPFVMVVSFLEPHPPFFGPLNDLHDPATLPTGDAFLEPPSADMARRNQLWARRFEHRFKKYPLESEWDWRRLRANYYGLISLVDRAVGEILAALEDSGRAEDTLVVFTSDHGEMMGDHAMLTKSVMYEEATRVPLLMRVPWLGRDQRLIEELVSQVDLVPTILDLLGIEVPSYLQGENQTPLLLGEQGMGRKHLTIMWHKESRRDSDARTIVSDDRWKLNVYPMDTWELFDLASDPFERKNLFDQADQGERIGQMYDTLSQWQAAVGDPLRLPEPEPGRSRGLFGSLRSNLSFF